MTEPTLRDKIIALPTQNGAVWKRDILVILDAHTAAQPAPDLCDVCGGHGMAGHPDSGAVCIPCNGTGGVKPAPDAVAEAMPPLAWLYAGYGRSVSIPPGYEILEPDPVCDAMLKHNGVVLARDEDAKLRDLAQRHFESVNAWYALAKGTRP